jgi:hypothetical protein
MPRRWFASIAFVMGSSTVHGCHMRA